MAVPVAFTVIRDIPLSESVVDVALGLPGAILEEDSLVIVALNGETTDIRAQISVGGAQVLPESSVTVQATIGVLPVTPDDVLIATFGKKGNAITIRGTNLDAVAARELRAKVQTFPTSDIMLLSQALRTLGIPIAG
jgi:hypothetical protein